MLLLFVFALCSYLFSYCELKLVTCVNAEIALVNFTIFVQTKGVTVSEVIKNDFLRVSFRSSVQQSTSFIALGPLAIPDVVTSRYWALGYPNVVTSRHWVPWPSQTSLPPGTGPPGYPRRRYLQVLGPPGYPRRRFFQVLGPLAIQDVVTYRLGLSGFHRRGYRQVFGPLAIPDVVSARYWAPWLSQTSFCLKYKEKMTVKYLHTTLLCSKTRVYFRIQFSLFLILVRNASPRRF